jgi:hypothetical protein
MQSFLKIVVPTALTAMALGTVAGYSLHKQPTESLQACVSKSGASQEPTAREGTPSGEEPFTEGSSWRRWPSLTDF